jgi:YHS domain-containing protein
MIAGCPEKDETKAEGEAKTEAEQPASVEDLAAGAKEEVADQEAEMEADAGAVADAEVEAMLAKADAFDGTTDKIVSKCVQCALAMDGDPEFATEAFGYTLHFCSAHCKETFEEDTTKAILAMEIPED